MRQQIEQAFADVPYPGDGNLCADKCALEECVICEGCDERFRGRHWKEVAAESLDHKLYAFTPSALRFYLPAYLLAGLKEVEDSLESVLFHLKPRTGGVRDQFFEVLATLSPAQKNAIRSFLEHVADGKARPLFKGQATKALEYWGRDWTQPAPEVPSTPARAARLRQQIEQAFASVPYPGDGKIGYDKYDWECVEVDTHFRRCHWKEVPRYALLYHDSDLPFFSPAGLRYYLPTYLFAALDDFGDTLDNTIYHLEPNAGKLCDYVLSRFAVFAPAERGAIKAFLEYVRDGMSDSLLKEHLARALEYWGRERT